MEYKNITFTREGSLCLITLNRPDALNALNRAMLHELTSAIDDLYTDNQLHGCILTGAGRAFAAGADIKELSACSPGQAGELSEFGQRLFERIANSPKPVLAAINGFALGGGCELAMACHFRIAAESARLGQPESALGIIPGYGATQRLTQLVGRGKALELMLTGDMITANDACAWGLVNEVVGSTEDLMSRARSQMDRISARSPLAVAKIIEAVNAGFDFEKRGYECERHNFQLCAASNDFREGAKAFIEKRKPGFTGT